LENLSKSLRISKSVEESQKLFGKLGNIWICGEFSEIYGIVLESLLKMRRIP
jgi:hypothetical protein